MKATVYLSFLYILNISYNKQTNKYRRTRHHHQESSPKGVIYTLSFAQMNEHYQTNEDDDATEHKNNKEREKTEVILQIKRNLKE